MRVALAQMESGPHPWENLSLVYQLVEEARGRNCDLVAFPENVFYRGPSQIIDPIDLALNRDGFLVPDSDFSASVKEFIDSLKIPIVLGSVREKNPLSAKPYNASWWIDPSGRIASYHKIHLFKYASTTSSVRYDESNQISHGGVPTVVGLNGWNFGLSICYDLRFPELYRLLTLRQRAQVLFVPAAFTYETGMAHWHTLLRTRAIENQTYVLAPAQWGFHQNDEGHKLRCFGHTVAYDPWGECLGDMGKTGDGLLVVDLKTEVLERVRERLPVLEHMRLLR